MATLKNEQQYCIQRDLPKPTQVLLKRDSNELSLYTGHFQLPFLSSMELLEATLPGVLLFNIAQF